MEKLRLKNGMEFEMVSVDFNAMSNTKKFEFTSELTHEEIKNLLVGVNEVDYVLADGSYTTYMDIVGLVSLKDNIQNGTYTAVFSTDLNAQLTRQLMVEIALLKSLIKPELKEPEPTEEPEEVEEPIEPDTPEEPTETE